ncbi:MAG: UvrB/UvrC motif-containing protein [Candidatus Latescibacterota bacterium]|jgi:hypothetical protein
MEQDIGELLDAWPFDPEANVRRIFGDDGMPKLQVRVDQGAFQGILQLNLNGRPDGRRPHGAEFALDHYRSALERHRQQQGGAARGFELGREACRELFDESSRVYGRYVFLLQLKDYGLVVRDTERNMELFRFVNAYAAHEEDRRNLERWWPYILRINATARAMQAADQGDYDQALRTVEEVRSRIRGLPEIEAEEFHVERERSEQALDELARELAERRPPTRLEILQQRLQEAVERDEFERAATIRDEIRRLADGGEPSRSA